MLKWLVQKMPDPIKSGIGKSDNGHITIENLTDDPLATLDLGYTDAKIGIRKKLSPSTWLGLGTHSEDKAWNEIYSVNRYDNKLSYIFLNQIYLCNH